MATDLELLLARAVQLEADHAVTPVEAVVLAAKALPAEVIARSVEELQEENAMLRSLLGDTAPPSAADAAMAALEAATPAEAVDAGDLDFADPLEDPDAVSAETAPVADVALVTPTVDAADASTLVYGKDHGFGPCPACGSDDADAYADGTARCADCGTALVKLESKGHDFTDTGHDFDDLDPAAAEPVEAETKTLTVSGGLSEFDLMVARRLQLDSTGA